ncbi:hypothetical protein, partial [Paradesulfitobacterium aromaticivorans]
GLKGCGKMPSKPLRHCSKPGCPNLTAERFCPEHAKQERQRYDRQRGSAHERGYTYRWYKYSKWFLSQPENVFCKLQLPGCTNLSECVDHIQAHNGPNDPLFWDSNNHQAACIHCNSVKGHRKIVGKEKPFRSMG